MLTKPGLSPPDGLVKPGLSAQDALIVISISARYVRLSHPAYRCIRLTLHLGCVGDYKIDLAVPSPNLFYVQFF